MSEVSITIECIEAVEPHSNAERLEIAKVAGTQTIIVKGQFKTGDLCVYFPPDVCIPDDVSKALGVAKYLKTAVFDGQKIACRVAACRLRGTPSYGFVQPLSACVNLLRYVYPGLDVTETFRGLKYEPPARVYRGYGGGTGEMWGGLAKEPVNFHRYTDIQHYRKYRNLLEAGLPVRITEKIHGCVRSNTRLTMADGSKKKISQIQVGDYVAGVHNGQIVPSQVTRTFKNGPSDKWMRVVIDRKGAGRGGNNVGAIHCTPNHKFWCRGDYISAERLRVGDAVTLLRTDIGLTPVQHAVLLGKMVGDGSIDILDSGAALISVGHKDMELLDWTSCGLSGLLTLTADATSGFGSVIHRAHTVASHAIAEAFGDFHTDEREFGAKRIPAWVADALTPLAIAFWYMDDGSLNHGNDGSEDKALFAVCRYNETDCEILVRGLARYGIDARYYTSNGYSRLRLNADDAERLFLLIAPYIPPALQYKLPTRYRGHDGWLPPTAVAYKSRLVPQRIVAIEEYTAPRADRYDIETKTHNYFANGVLTHNSNSRIGLLKVDGEWQFYAGSHKTARKQIDPEGRLSVYWEPLQREGVLNLLTDLCNAHQEPTYDVILFGELYGPGVQDLDYGIRAGEIGWRLFDMMVNGQYLDWDRVKEHCTTYGVEMVPLLYEGPFRSELVDDLTYGPTVVAAEVKSKFKSREGIVITPLVEQQCHIGRLILKNVSADYLDRRGAQDGGEL